MAAKFTFAGIVRRVSISTSISFAELAALLGELFGAENIELQYTDTDGDQVSVSSEQELQEALRLGGQSMSFGCSISAVSRLSRKGSWVQLDPEHSLHAVWDGRSELRAELVSRTSPEMSCVTSASQELSRAPGRGLDDRDTDENLQHIMQALENCEGMVKTVQRKRQIAVAQAQEENLLLRTQQAELKEAMRNSQETGENMLRSITELNASLERSRKWGEMLEEECHVLRQRCTELEDKKVAPAPPALPELFTQEEPRSPVPLEPGALQKTTRINEPELVHVSSRAQTGLTSICEMGFSAQDASVALHTTRGNVDAAIALLLDGTTAPASPEPVPPEPVPPEPVPPDMGRRPGVEMGATAASQYPPLAVQGPSPPPGMLRPASSFPAVSMGAFVFLCNNTTCPPCIDGSIFGLPSSKMDEMTSIVPIQEESAPTTMILLWNFQRKQLHGIWVAGATFINQVTSENF